MTLATTLAVIGAILALGGILFSIIYLAKSVS